MYRTRLHLPQVTIWTCCWSRDAAMASRCLRVLQYCRRIIDCQRLVFLTAMPVSETPGIEVRRIFPDRNFNWNVFVNRDVPKLIPADFLMSVHEDGFPIRTDLWSDDFLKYDYIGAPWNDDVVGNGGFNIESRKLLEQKAIIPNGRYDNANSDVWTCRVHRARFEAGGITFAPVDVAARFATELPTASRPYTLESFGFHGRRDTPAKYAEGWRLIAESEALPAIQPQATRPTKRSGLKITLVYTYPLAGKDEYFTEASRFVGTYHGFPPLADHDTLIVCNGAPCDDRAKPLFETLPNCKFLDHDNAGMDIGGFIAAAKTVLDSDFIVCCGANLHFHRAGWLARMAEAWTKRGRGVYGSSASYECSPHINTTGFWCSPKDLSEYPFPVITKHDRYNFEHGLANKSMGINQPDDRRDRTFWRMMCKAGRPAMLVTWDGEYPWWEWRKPKNIFRRGDQSNLLVWWKHTDNFVALGPHLRDMFERSTDALTDPSFNLRRKTFS